MQVADPHAVSDMQVATTCRRRRHAGAAGGMPLQSEGISDQRPGRGEALREDMRGRRMKRAIESDGKKGQGHQHLTPRAPHACRHGAYPGRRMGSIPGQRHPRADAAPASAVSHCISSASGSAALAAPAEHQNRHQQRRLKSERAGSSTSAFGAYLTARGPACASILTSLAA